VVAVARGRSARRMKVPFAPFLAVGSLVALFWGDALIDAYLSTF
jgi:prepilin signal peptidase PulO-like enzyme (type II secretory pathway)